MGTMYAQGSDVGEFPNSTSADNSTEFSRSGSSVNSITNNTSDTASSDALITTRVEGTSGGDPYIKMQVGNSDSWSFGPANSAALPANYRITYNPDGSASPSNFTNAPLTIDGVNTVTAESRVVVAHSFAVAGLNGISAGVATKCHVLNDNPELLSDAQVMIQSGDPNVGLGGGDMFVSYQAPNMVQFGHGVSKDVSPTAWQLNTDNSDLRAGNVAIVAATGGEVTFPSTPAFFAALTANEPNVTGNGTVHTVGSISGFNVIFDQNSDFSGNTFTAPVTGRYEFFGMFRFTNVGNGHTRGIAQISTSNRAASFYMGDVSATQSANNNVSGQASYIVDMDAGDTSILTCFADNSTQTVGIDMASAVDPLTFFCGSLQC